MDILSLEYSGELVNNGRIPAKIAAKNITSFNSFIEIISKEILGYQNVDVEIDAFRGDSFDIDFIVELTEHAVPLLVSAPTSVDGLVEYIKEFISLYKHLAGKPPKNMIEAENGVQVENQDGIINQYKAETINIVINNNTNMSESLKGFTDDPLGVEGIDELNISTTDEDRNKINISTVSKNERLSLSAEPITSTTETTTTLHRTVLTIISPSFKEDNKWKFTDGQSIILAKIEDQSFNDKVDKSLERFGKGDKLTVLMEQTQTTNHRDELISEKIIKEVLEHSIAPTDSKLL